MYAYRQSVRGLSIAEAMLSEYIAQGVQRNAGHRPTPGEIRSWTMSLPALRADLVSAGLNDVEMLFEYQLPLSSKRADVVLVGEHPQGGPSYLVVELKQWSSATLYEDSDSLVCIPQYGTRPIVHPSIQVRGYCDYLADFVAVLQDAPNSLAGAAYLHNATELDVSQLRRLPADHRSRLFTGQGRGEFVEFLRSRFTPTGGGGQYADQLLESRIAPSKQLLAIAAEEVQRREMFTLLDEQRTAYEFVSHAVNRARRTNKKTAVVVTGGPGSGKSVIALSLLGDLSRQGRSVVHATGSQSFTKTLRRVAGAKSTRTQRLFMYFNSFMSAEPNELDCLILDEAHRIRATSANRYTSKKQREMARPQVQELLAASRVPVFLLDQYQVVRPGEVGTVDIILAAAKQEGIDVEVIKLDDQFRCGGSKAYVSWVLRLLGLDSGEPIPWRGDHRFELDVADSPEEMESRLQARRGEGYGARIAAGYCWPWSDPRPDGTLVTDVVVGSWARPWNLKGDRSVDGAPASPYWATDPAGFGQVGCVYTAQGFEYDYAGVILGPDLLRRGDRWVTNRDGSRDPAFRSRKTVSDSEFDRLVRHVYKVLLTRGLRGALLYSTDPETQSFLEDLIRAGSSPRAQGPAACSARADAR